MGIFSRLVALALALGLVALGVVGAGEAIWQLSGRGQHLWADYYMVATQLQSLSWGHPYVLGSAAALVMLGALLLVAGLCRGPQPLRLATAGSDTRMEVPQRTVRQLVANAAMAVTGVAAAKVRARRRKITIRATTTPDPPEALRDHIAARVQEQLDDLAPLRRPRVRTRLRTPRRNSKR